MKMELLEDLYAKELSEARHAENQLSRTLPKMAKATHSEELRSLFKSHNKVTKAQLKRLDQILGRLGQTELGVKSKPMKGILGEAKDLLKQKDADPQVLDAALITAAEKVEHLEIATYASLLVFARLLNASEDANLLHQTLEEEKQMENKLAALAQSIGMEASKGTESTQSATE